MKGYLCCGTLPLVLLHGFEIWNLFDEHICQFEAFDDRCLPGIAGIEWIRGLSNVCRFRECAVEIDGY